MSTNAKTIYLIRHGQARAGTADYDRLSALGEQQVLLLGRYLREAGCLPAELWSGSLRRQQQSAAHFLRGSEQSLPVGIEPGLNEYDHRAVHQYYYPAQADTTRETGPGGDQDLPGDMSYATYTEIIRRWAADQRRADAEAAHFESWAQFTERTLEAMLRIAHNSSADSIALFTSGGVISVIAGQLRRYDEQQIATLIWDLNNASLNTLQVKAGEAGVISLNEVRHLEQQNDSALITQI